MLTVNPVSMKKRRETRENVLARSLDGDYSLFKKLDFHLDKITARFSVIFVLGLFLVTALAVGVEYTKTVEYIVNSIFAVGVLVILYVVALHKILSVLRDKMIASNHLKYFLETSAEQTQIIIMKAPTKVNVTYIGDTAYIKSSGVKVELPNEVFKVDLYVPLETKPKALKTGQIYNGTILYITGRPTLIVG